MAKFASEDPGNQLGSVEMNARSCMWPTQHAVGGSTGRAQRLACGLVAENQHMSLARGSVGCVNQELSPTRTGLRLQHGSCLLGGVGRYVAVQPAVGPAHLASCSCLAVRGEAARRERLPPAAAKGCAPTPGFSAGGAIIPQARGFGAGLPVLMLDGLRSGDADRRQRQPALGLQLRGWTGKARALTSGTRITLLGSTEYCVDMSQFRSCCHTALLSSNFLLHPCTG